MKTILILNNIRSNENVGSIFRTCDAVEVSKIILVGYTPAPLDRFGRENKGLAKAALGAEKFVEWERVENLKEAIENLNNSPLTPLLQQERGTEHHAFKIVAIEQDKKSINYKKIKEEISKTGTQNIVLIFGNEVEGLSPEDLKLCDVVAEIPMGGSMVRQAHHPRYSKRGKESLNVAVSVGVVLYSLV